MTAHWLGDGFDDCRLLSKHPNNVAPRKVGGGAAKGLEQA
jgi:hypothetical protein